MSQPIAVSASCALIPLKGLYGSVYTAVTKIPAAVKGSTRPEPSAASVAES